MHPRHLSACTLFLFACTTAAEEPQTSTAAAFSDGCVTVSPPGLASNQLCNGSTGDFKAMHDRFDATNPGPSFGWLLDGEKQRPTWGVAGNPVRPSVVFERVLLNSVDGGHEVGIGFAGLWALKRAREGFVVGKNWEESIPEAMCNGTYYPQTGHCLAPEIQAAYDATGGSDKLLRHGYPISELVPGVLEDGTFAWVQYTEKSRFEVPIGSIGPFPGFKSIAKRTNDVSVTRLGVAFLANQIAFNKPQEAKCHAESCTCSSANIDITCASPQNVKKALSMTWQDLVDTGIINNLTAEQPEAKVESEGRNATCDELLAEACMGAEAKFDAVVNGSLAAVKAAFGTRFPSPEDQAILKDPQTKCMPVYRPVFAKGSCE